MTTIPHEASDVVQGAPSWSARLLVPEMWASLAIVVMWLAVLFDAVYGPDIVSTNGTGVGTGTRIPSSIVVALFAFLGTRVVAKYGFGRERKE